MSSPNRNTYSLMQHNLAEGKVKTTTEHRKEIFCEIKEHTKDNKNIDDMLITRDFNQHVASKES